ncbi:MAG TPA: hypothetical protein VFM14_17955 [Gemmatimonadales bacterium]|nr:hypothetical protein [Gemmatimonadales bacterium]
MRYQRVRPSIEIIVDSGEQTRAIAIERSREAAEQLWDQIIRGLAGDPFAPASAVPSRAAR